MLETMKDQLTSAVQEVALGVADFVPKIFVAVVFLALGWIFGSAVGKVVRQLVEAAKADEWLRKAGVDKVFERAGYTLNTGVFLGWLAKLFFVVVFLIAAFDVLGLSEVNEFLRMVVGYIPQVIVAAVILFVASVAADIVGGAVSGAAKAAGGSVAHFLSSLVRWAIWIFAFMFALAQLGVAPQFMQILFTGIVAMLALAGGLAFGLGGKDAAAEFIRKVQTEIREGRRE